MKKLTVVLTLVLFFVSSCQEDEVMPQRTDQELLAVTVEKVQSNENVLEDVFLKTSTKITRTVVQEMLKSSTTKAAFINNMNALVEGVFETEVKSNSEQMASDVFLKLDDIKGESVKKMVTELVVDATADDPLVTYSNKVKSLLDIQRSSSRGLLVLIAKVVDERGSQAVPEEQVSLNFDKISLMYDLHDRVIRSDVNSTSAQTDTEIDQILSSQGISPVALALLLPAVQKFNGFNGGSQSASLPYWDWLMGVVNPELNGGLNRYTVRRYNMAGFMGALQFLLSEEYRNDNQDLASMLLLRARYQASMMFIWSDIWERNRLASVMQLRVKNNEKVLQNAFIETSKIVTRTAILDARATSPDKATFIAKMNRLVAGVFDREVQNNSEQYSGGVNVATGDINGDGSDAHLQELVINSASDPLTGYSNIIQAKINSRATKQGNISGDLDPMFTIVSQVTENSRDKEAFMSASALMISNARTFKDAILNGSKSGTDPDKALEDLRMQHDIPKPLMALILPAVQKVRAYDGTAEKADTPYLQWLDSLNPMIVGGVNHDVVTKYDAAGYLGALNLFVSDNYRSDNQDYASILLLKARFHASLVMLWSDLYGK